MENNKNNKLRKPLTKLIANILFIGSIMGVVGIISSFALSTPDSSGAFSFGKSAEAAGTVRSWWPVQGARMTGVQPFKGVVEGRDITTYQMFWEVDGGTWNWMGDNWDGYQHKEASVNLSGWNWKGSGPYTITFIAREFSGAIIGRTSMAITIGGAEPVVISAPVSAPAPAAPVNRLVTILPIGDPIPLAPPAPVVAPVAPVPTPVIMPVVPAPTPTVSGLRGAKLYVADSSAAKNQAEAWRASRSADAAAMDKLAAQPTAAWFGGWNANVETDARNYVSKADSQNATAVIVAYNIPARDCGSYSAGGAGSPDAYRSWIRSLAAGIGNKAAAVILEPDAVAGMDCLSSTDQSTRLALIKEAVAILKAQPNTSVYVDAGNSHWQSADMMASRLGRAGIDRADGFSLNVSNYYTTSDVASFGRELSGKLSGKHFVIDTSRNGNGSNGEWCNPSGRAVGQKPTTNTGNSLVDAYIWAKVPGESDGWCNGGPGAGQWWAEYALGLVQRASW